MLALRPACGLFVLAEILRLYRKLIMLEVEPNWFVGGYILSLLIGHQTHFFLVCCEFGAGVYLTEGFCDCSTFVVDGQHHSEEISSALVYC